MTEFDDVHSSTWTVVFFIFRRNFSFFFLNLSTSIRRGCLHLLVYWMHSDKDKPWCTLLSYPLKNNKKNRKVFFTPPWPNNKVIKLSLRIRIHHFTHIYVVCVNAIDWFAFNRTFVSARPFVLLFCLFICRSCATTWLWFIFLSHYRTKYEFTARSSICVFIQPFWGSPISLFVSLSFNRIEIRTF